MQREQGLHHSNVDKTMELILVPSRAYLVLNISCHGSQDHKSNNEYTHHSRERTSWLQEYFMAQRAPYQVERKGGEVVPMVVGLHRLVS